VNTTTPGKEKKKAAEEKFPVRRTRRERGPIDRVIRFLSSSP
jgi:hypothetical protein